MKKFSVICLSAMLATSCGNNVKKTNVTDTFPLENSDTVEIVNVEQVYKDSVGVMGYNTDENGICEGLPKEYKHRNESEEKLMSSLSEYYRAIIKKDTETAKSFLCPKMISLTKEKFPESSDEEISKVMMSSLLQLSDMVNVLKERFEFYKKSVPMVANMNKLPSKDGCLLYSVHYSLVILCTEDDTKYYAWHMPMFLYAASYDNGKKWYFIELVEDSNEVLKDFQ